MGRQVRGAMGDGQILHHLLASRETDPGGRKEWGFGCMDKKKI